MIIKLKDKNKDTILINTNHIVSINLIKGTNTGSRINLANTDRADATVFTYETPDEVYNVIELARMAEVEESKIVFKQDIPVELPVNDFKKK